MYIYMHICIYIDIYMYTDIYIYIDNKDKDKDRSNQTAGPVRRARGVEAAAAAQRH